MGVDIGIRNFAWYGARLGQGTWDHLDWGNTELVHGSYRLAKARAALRNWVANVKAGSYDVAVLETQMKLRYVNISIELAILLSEEGVRVVTYRPSEVKKRLGTRGISYRDNKRLAVRYCRNVLPDSKGKKDDLADAFLLVYYHWLVGNNLTVPVTEIPRYAKQGSIGGAAIGPVGREEKVPGAVRGHWDRALRLLDQVAEDALNLNHRSTEENGGHQDNRDDGGRRDGVTGDDSAQETQGENTCAPTATTSTSFSGNH